MKTTHHFVPENLEKRLAQWLVPVKYGEFAWVSSYPNSDIERRVNQIAAKPGFVLWDIKNDEYRVEWHKDDLTILVIVDPSWHDLAERIAKMQLLRRRYGSKFVIFCDQDWLDRQMAGVQAQLKSFEPRIGYHGLYERDVTLQYVLYLQTKWEFSLPSTLQETIIKSSGGHLGLAKEIFWNVMQGTDLPTSLDQPQLLMQVKSLWDKLSSDQQACLRALTYKVQPSTNTMLARQYLGKVGIVEKDNSIRIGLLESYIKQFEPDPSWPEISGDQVVILGRNVTTLFSQKQRAILKYLVERKGSLVSRSELFELLWDNDDHAPSDWALDCQINRLRRKLEEIGIGGKHIVTKRGKGVVWQCE